SHPRGTRSHRGRRCRSSGTSTAAGRAGSTGSGPRPSAPAAPGTGPPCRFFASLLKAPAELRARARRGGPTGLLLDADALVRVPPPVDQEEHAAGHRGGPRQRIAGDRRRVVRPALAHQRDVEFLLALVVDR